MTNENSATGVDTNGAETSMPVKATMNTAVSTNLPISAFVERPEHVDRDDPRCIAYHTMRFNAVQVCKGWSEESIRRAAYDLVMAVSLDGIKFMVGDEVLDDALVDKYCEMKAENLPSIMNYDHKCYMDCYTCLLSWLNRHLNNPTNDEWDGAEIAYLTTTDWPKYAK